AYHTGLKIDFLVGATPLIKFSAPDYYVVPLDYVAQITEDYVTLRILKDEIQEVNFTNLESLFVKDRQKHDKKRYII
ncbi:MAG: hypothetical protein ACFFBD_22980, partial [Candidatus Hodarchaeota archaeon]